MENQPPKSSKFPSSNWAVMLKAFLIFIFLPIVAVWYVWKKTTWSKRNKWIATVAIALVTLFLFAANSEKQANQKSPETQALEAQVAALQNKLDQEKQKNVVGNSENIAPAVSNDIQAKQLYDVVGVTDGDTIKVSIDGKMEALRLIGIDTPETVDPRKPVQCFGQEASNKAKEILNGKKITLEADPTQGERDQYGRLLRYVFLEDGTFFNQKMIEDGYAHEYTYQSKPYKYQSEFQGAENSARESKRGLWAPETCNGDTAKPASTEKTVSVSVPEALALQVSAQPITAQPTQPASTGGVVKKSSTGICHAPGTTYYAKTKTFTSYDSIDACLSSGGRLPLR